MALSLPFPKNVDHDRFLWDVSQAFKCSIEEAVDVLAYTAIRTHNVVVKLFEEDMKHVLGVDELPKEARAIMAAKIQALPVYAPVLFIKSIPKVRENIPDDVVKGAFVVVPEVEPACWDRIPKDQPVLSVEGSYQDMQHIRQHGFH